MGVPQIDKLNQFNRIRIELANELTNLLNHMIFLEVQLWKIIVLMYIIITQ